MLQRAFPDKVTPDIYFRDGVVVECNVPVVKILLKVLAVYKWLHKCWCEYLFSVSGPSFVYGLVS